jgi:hypothetical protein
VPGWISSTGTVRRDARDLGSSVAVRFPPSSDTAGFHGGLTVNQVDCVPRHAHDFGASQTTQRQPPARSPLILGVVSTLAWLCCFLGTFTPAATLTDNKPEAMP